jgi:hypothetical protein
MMEPILALILLLILVQSAHINRKVNKIMATQSDLDAAIAGLPKAIEDALAPVIAAIVAKSAGTPVDFTPEITALQGIPAAVSTAVTPAAPATAAKTA